MDNLNTHNISSLYEAFAPEEAFRLAQRLEIHHTPKHGSWLNIAESELSALGRQCLGTRRIDSMEKLNAEMTAWHQDRNDMQSGVDWQFTTKDARIKLKRLYPAIV
jgi:recombinational DNA repair ATPase RecF